MLYSAFYYLFCFDLWFIMEYFPNINIKILSKKEISNKSSSKINKKSAWNFFSVRAHRNMRQVKRSNPSEKGNRASSKKLRYFISTIIIIVTVISIIKCGILSGAQSAAVWRRSSRARPPSWRSFRRWTSSSRRPCTLGCLLLSHSVIPITKSMPNK